MSRNGVNAHVREPLAKASMRISLKQLVIVAPLLAALILAFYSYHNRQKQDYAVDHYRTSVRRGSHASPQFLLEAVGRDRCRAIITSLGNTRDTLFDGSDRWCQIIRVPNTHGHGRGDEFTLFSLANGFHRTRTLPPGGILKSIVFDGNDVVFSIYGDMPRVINEESLLVPEGDPAVYRFRWEPGARPPEADLNSLLARDPRRKATKAP